MFQKAFCNDNPSEKIDTFSAEKYGVTWRKVALLTFDAR
jgi:hypothetical protein